jgi:hypothetical protein
MFFFPKLSQEQRVINVLRGNGEKGVHSFWGYRNWIPRIGARIFVLKQKGYEIDSLPAKGNAGCVYVLKESPTQKLQHMAVEHGIRLRRKK